MRERERLSFVHSFKNFVNLQTLRDANVTEIKAIAAFQHAHLLGVGITTRHFRNGTELPAIIHDPNYDFYFQEVRKLKHEVTIKQVRDEKIIDCQKLSKF